MKATRARCLSALVWALLASSAFAAASTSPDVPSGPGQVPPVGLQYPIDQPLGLHHKLVDTILTIPDGSGKLTPVHSRYVHLEPGLHYLDNGQLQESQPVLELTPQGIVGRRTQHKVVIQTDIAEPWSVEVLTANGTRIRSQVLGISLYDAESGRSVLLGEVVSTPAKLANGSEVWFQDCFDDIRADVQYVYTSGSLDQNVILRQPLPDPAVFGFNPSASRLEILTEFDRDVQPTEKLTRFVRHEQDPDKRAHMAEPDFEDDELVFGSMRMARGRAFALSRNTPDQSCPVGKRWTEMDQRQFLIEQVEVLAMVQALKELGEDQPPPVPRRQADVRRQFPERNLVRTSPGRKARAELAKADSLARPGLVVDYNLLNDITGSVSFGTGTYYVAAPATITGGATFPAGMIIKYAAGASITVNGYVLHYASSGSPISCTAKDDNTVGETISGSSGNPTGYYASFCLWGQANSAVAPDPMRYWDFRRASIGLKFSPSAYSRSVQYCWFRNCGTGIYIDGINLPVQNSDFCGVSSQYQTVNGGSVSPSGNTICGGSGNSAPYFTSSPINKPSATSGSSYSSSISGDATDPNGDALTFSKVSGPAWLSIGSNGSISGTPGSSDVGANSWTVRVQDPSAAYSDGTLNITVQSSSWSPLGEAVDNTSLNWSTGGSGNWFSQTSTTYSGGDAAQSGPITDSQSTYLQTTVTGPGTLSFYWSVYSEQNCDYLRFYIDGALQASISGVVNWTRQSYFVDSGSHTLKWEYAKDATVSSSQDAGWVDYVQFDNSGGWVALGEALDDTSHSWSSGGPASWAGESSIYYWGGDAAQSGPITHNQSCYLQTTANGPDTVRFYWKVSSEQNCDFLRFYIDGVQQSAISGAVDWNLQTASIASGTHTLKWEYSKDGSASAGSDCGWVDYVQFGGQPPPGGTLGEAVDNPSLNWITGGNFNWVAETTTAYSGGDAAQSGSITHLGSSYLQTSVTGPGTLGFYWKVSSEYFYDFLRFYIDGVQQTAISGEVGWTPLSYSIASGSHTLKWEYTKDGSVTAGSDAGWVDLVSFTIVDTDSDGLPDAWEQQYFGNLNQSGSGDYDGDGVTNLQEYQNGTNPAAANLAIKIGRPRTGANLP